MADITLSKAVRSNLLNLQSTAAQMAKTQQRLASGLKVNSALDNPSSFFTASSLNNRAGDLSSLLDSIGQATNTLDAANNGITSLTNLVQNAKSIATQARQATGAANTYSSVDSSSNILSSGNLNGSESVASFTGANTSARSNELEAKAITITGAGTLGADTAATFTSTNGADTFNATAISVTGAALAETKASITASTAKNDAALTATPPTGTVRIAVSDRNGAVTNFDVSLAATDDTQAEVVAAFQGTSNGSVTFDSLFDVSFVADALTITSKTASTDFTIQDNTASGGITTDAALTNLGLTGAEVNTTANSSSIYDQMLINDPSLQNKTLLIDGTDAAGTAFATQTITFGTGVGEVNNLDDLNTALQDAASATGGAFTANANLGGAGTNVTGELTFTKTAGTKSSLTIGGTINSVNSNAVILEGNTAGDVFGTHNSAATLGDVAQAGGLSLGSPPSLTFNINGTDTTVNLAATDRIDDVINKLTAVTALTDNLDISKSGNDNFTINAKNASVDYTIQANGTSAALGLTTSNIADNVNNSDSLFNRLTAQGAVQGDTLTIAGTGADGVSIGDTQTITFGNGGVKTIADLNSELQAAASARGGAYSAAVSGGQITITKPAGTQASITVGGTIATNSDVKELLEGTTSGTVFSTHNSQPTLADINAAQGRTDLATGGALNFSVNGASYTVGLAGTDRVDDVINKLSASSVASKLSFSKTTDTSGHDHIKIDAKDASVDFQVLANTTSDALGLTADSTTSTVDEGKSTSLLDLIDTKLGGTGLAEGKTLTVGVNGGASQTITFGTGAHEVQTLDQLNTKLSELSGVTASVSNAGALSIAVASGSSETTLTIGGTGAAALGLTAGTQTGVVISTTNNATRERLQSDFNTVLKQIDDLSQDAKYNGINLLNGDDLKVSFNEDGSSSLTISGVTFDSGHLGLTTINGEKFQDNSQIDEVISTIDSALGTLRSQSSTFGSNLSVVQNRQDFTKAMVNTLQTGAASLTLADTNEEAANLLALQTRQQLSSTALSLASQADQNVLRLF